VTVIVLVTVVVETTVLTSGLGIVTVGVVVVGRAGLTLAASNTAPSPMATAKSNPPLAYALATSSADFSAPNSLSDFINNNARRTVGGLEEVSSFGQAWGGWCGAGDWPNRLLGPEGRWSNSRG